VRLMKPLLQVGVSIGIVGIVFWRVPVAALWSTLAKLDAALLAPALICVAAMLAVRSLKWHRLLLAGSYPAVPGESARSLFGGFALGLVFPGRIGELGRCLFVAESERPRVLLLNILDRALDLWALLTLAVASLFVLVARPAAISAVSIWLAFLPVLLGLPTLVAGLGRLPCWPKAFRAQLADTPGLLAPIRTAPLAAWSLLSTFLDLLIFFCVLRAFHPASFSVALATFVWIVLAGGLPVAFSGLGLREAAAALVLAPYAVPAAAALDAALLSYALTAVLPAIVGGVWIICHRQRPRLKNVRELATLMGRA